MATGTVNGRHAPAHNRGVVPLEDRTRPHDPQAEEAIVAGALLAERLAGPLADVAADEFYVSCWRTVWRVLRDMAREGLPLSFSMVRARLSQDDAPSGGWHTALMRVIDEAPTPEGVAACVRRVKKAAGIRMLHEHAEMLLKLGVNDDPDAASQALSDALAIRGGGAKLDMLPFGEFMRRTYEIKYLVEGLVVERQHGLIGGLGKTLKTKLAAIDLAVSLASGTPFAGRFAVPERKRVAIFSGESGEFTLQDTARRVAESKGFDESSFDSLAIFMGFKLPKLTVQADLAALRSTVRANGIEVLLIDPAYLCLLSGETKGRQASNIFDMGSVLGDLSGFASEMGVTLLLYHHLTRHSGDFSRAPELKDLAFAGFSEWARQWLLLGRRSEYQGDGHHELWMTAGGSAGHAGTWAVDVDEGLHASDLRWEKWCVDVRPASQVKQEAKERSERRRADRQQESHDQAVAALRVAFRKRPDGDTASELRLIAEPVLSPVRTKSALATLNQRGEIEQLETKRKNCVIWRATEHLLGPKNEAARGQPESGERPSDQL